MTKAEIELLCPECLTEGEMTWELTKEDVAPSDVVILRSFEEFRLCSIVKFAIAREVAPARILEIGVRAGYSAIAFLKAAPSALYLGIDADNDAHGGNKKLQFMTWAKKLLSPYNATIVHADSQAMQEPPGPGKWNLIHVDGDHTAAGCRRDMELLWPAVSHGGLMLVDDYRNLEPVRRAVGAFAVDHPETSLELRESPRGEALFWKQEDQH